jgi:cyclopropane fatty-acyl-phospholipid synthase-like methyltransferase
MRNGEQQNVYNTYNRIAGWFAANRGRDLMEKKYLDAVVGQLPAGASVLDLGCGTGEPILRYLLQQGLQVTGVDASQVMLQLARNAFPQTTFLLQDMRQLQLPQRFHAIIAWHSFFHLPAADQPAMFPLFAQHLHPGGLLLFTSGTEHGEAWGEVGGENLYHASLDTQAYAQLLQENGFRVLQHTVSDPACGYATVWMAALQPGNMQAV